ncbi:MAG: MATE family efflux transporter [Acidimicrobiia bacterium]
MSAGAVGGGRGRWPARRSPYDAEIWRLALPAFGALAAEPLYVLVDTAIVGQLGTPQLAGLAIAGTLLTAAYGLCNFLAYSTTAAVARQLGAGDRRAAAALGVDGAWLAAGIGVALAIVGLATSSWIVDAMGASPGVRPYALEYLRISLVGAPFMLVMLAGAGYLRGLQDTRTTLVVAVAANVVNLALEVLFVYGFDWGVAGSAWGTVIAQIGAGVTYMVILGRTARAERAPLTPTRAGVRQTAVVGGPLIVRTAALLVVLLATTALAARISDDAVAAHQIAIQVLLFLALSLDALAIAGQAMIGRFLGASSVHEARAAARRMIEWGILVGVAFGVVLALVRPWLVPLFTDDPGVQDLAEQLLLIVAVIQPVNAYVFVLDGVLIGAGDQRFLALAMLAATFAVYAPVAIAVSLGGGGIVALWGALALWSVARAVGVGARYLGPHWQVTGAVRA